MLANNHICKVQSQNFKLLQQQWMQTNLQGDSISVLMPLKNMFANNPTMTSQFATEAFKLFSSRGLCKQSDFSDCYEQLATYGVTMSNFFMSLNLDTGNFGLYTSSYSILEMLAHQGILKPKKDIITTELEKFKEVLVTGNRIRNSMSKGGMIQAVRLEPEVQGNSVTFTATVPRSQLDMLREIIVPFQGMDFAMQYINKILQEKILRFTMGDKVRVVTKNYAILSMIYGEERAKYLISRAYDARTSSFYVPSVGASIYTSGLTNLSLIDIDKIEVIQSIQDIDLSDIKVDYTKAKDYYKQCIELMSVDQLRILAARVTQNGVVPHDSELSTFLTGEFMNVAYDRDIYDLMKSNPDLFNLANYGSLQSKYGTNFEYLNVPTSKQEFEELLKTGAFKVLITKRNGSMSTIICSNSPSVLAKVYGKDYYKIYESEGTKLKGLDFCLRSSNRYPDGIITIGELRHERNRYGLDYVFDSFIPEDDENDSKPIKISLLMPELMDRLGKVESRKTVVKQPNLVTVRSLESYTDEVGYPKNYYKNIDLSCVISIIKLS